ncbi:two-component system sensor histidine kinase YesM [Neobacillus niacini]|uniref:cache domain-containing sensor histidine kinase n=1 Tax=Neobacillus niacini TaxID=86668 RepID=UPI00277F1B07|nr:sensor histidine kinase [Neobacillus niacini]MDQ1004878.1 two-component system sensor histidine kinase YesM [Neobacillus niacini]
MIFKHNKQIQINNIRLSTKLIITYVLLTVIPMALLGIVMYNQYSKSIEVQVGEYIPQLLSQANNNIENEIGKLENLSELIYSSGEVMEVLRNNRDQNKSSLRQGQYTVQSYLTNIYLNSNNPDILGAFLVSNNRLFASTRTSYEGFSFKDRSYEYQIDFPQAEGMELLLPSQLNLTFKNNPSYFLLAKQITDFDNRKNLGTLYVAVNVTFFEKFLEDLQRKENTTMWLMDQQGDIIYHTNNQEIGKKVEAIHEYPLLNGSFRMNSYGQKTLISLGEAKEFPWILAHSIPLKNLKEQTGSVRNVTVFLFIIVICITTLISIFLAWTVTRPIKQLSRIMKDVETGNFSVEVPIHSGDEVGMLATSFRTMLTKIRELIQKNYLIEIRQKNAELYALQSQINPHFMYNTLETIGMAVEDGEREQVVRMITILGRMMRFSISNKDSLIPISSEVQHIQDYLNIQKFRFEDRLSFIIREDVDSSKYYTPKFLLQPIIENAIKYGLERRKELVIEIEVVEEQLEEGPTAILFIIRDNGPGVDEATLVKLRKLLSSDPMKRRDSGFGIINVYARIAMMFGENYGLLLKSEIDKGTEVVIRIPKTIEANIANFARGSAQ